MAVSCPMSGQPPVPCPGSSLRLGQRVLEHTAGEGAFGTIVLGHLTNMAEKQELGFPWIPPTCSIILFKTSSGLMGLLLLTSPGLRTR